MQRPSHSDKNVLRNLGKLQNKRFPLLGFNFGGLRLREMNVEVGNEGSLHVKAIFGTQLARNKQPCRTEEVGRCDAVGAAGVK
jgi:hypothetical protein